MSALDVIDVIVEDDKNICIVSCGRSGSHALYHYLRDDRGVDALYPTEPLLPEPLMSYTEEEILTEIRRKKRVVFICQIYHLYKDNLPETRRVLFKSRVLREGFDTLTTNCRFVKVTRNFYDICSSMVIANIDDKWAMHEWTNGVRSPDFYHGVLTEEYCFFFFNSVLKNKKLFDNFKAHATISYDDLPNVQHAKNKLICSSVHERIRKYYKKWREELIDETDYQAVIDCDY